MKKVSDQQLNQKLGVSNWRDRINQAADDWEAWSRKFEMENLVDKLRREYTCAGCGAVKDNYYPYEKGGKKYCSLDCRDGKEKGGKREISELRDHLKDLGGSVEKLLGLLLDWIKREKPVEIRLEGNKLVIKKANGKTENLEEKDLTPAQLGLKKYLERSAKKSLNQSELESLVEGTLKEEKTRSKRKDLVATIGGIFIFIVILAIIIGIVVWISKKTKK